MEQAEDVRDDHVVDPQHRVRIDEKDQGRRDREQDRTPGRANNRVGKDSDVAVAAGFSDDSDRLVLEPTGKRPGSAPEDTNQEEVLEEPEGSRTVEVVSDLGEGIASSGIWPRSHRLVVIRP